MLWNLVHILNVAYAGCVMIGVAITLTLGITEYERALAWCKSEQERKLEEEREKYRH